MHSSEDKDKIILLLLQVIKNTPGGVINLGKMVLEKPELLAMMKDAK